MSIAKARHISRSLSLLLALVCLWMSSGATLNHTDDLSMFRTFATGRTGLGHATPASVDTPCVAHEWMNAWQTLHTPHVAVVRSRVSIASLQQSLSPALHLNGFDYVSLRGPPALRS